MSASLSSLVDRGLEIVAEMATLTKELKGIETKIKNHAKARSDQHEPLADDAREGRVYKARGTALILPVVFTADKLVGTFQTDSKEWQRIVTALKEPKHFAEFFRPWTGFENRFDDGLKFRAHAAELLGKEAPAFITACLARDKDGLPKSDIKIEWKQAAAAAKLEEVAA